MMCRACGCAGVHECGSGTALCRIDWQAHTSSNKDFLFILFHFFLRARLPLKKSYPIRCHPVSSVTFHMAKYEQALSSPNPVSFPLARPCLAPGAGQTFCLHVAPHGVCLSTRTRSPWLPKCFPRLPSLPFLLALSSQTAAKETSSGVPAPLCPFLPVLWGWKDGWRWLRLC